MWARFCGARCAMSCRKRDEYVIAVNIEVMRALVRMRELLTSNHELAQRFQQLEARIQKILTTHDEAIVG